MKISLGELESLVADFEAKTLPLESWTHQAHLAVAMYYLHKYSYDQALAKIRYQIIEYNAICGVGNSFENGYHETLTQFWMWLISAYLERNKDDLEALVNRFLQSIYAQKNVPFIFYSSNTMGSICARASHMRPDLNELHFDLITNETSIKKLENKKDLAALIDLFYDKVKCDPTLSIIFNNPNLMNWEQHIPKMVNFWEAQIFRKHDYKSDFMEKHVKLHEKVALNKQYFDRWTQLFHSSVDELFIGENANWIKMKAVSMSTMMMVKIHRLRDKSSNDSER